MHKRLLTLFGCVALAAGVAAAQGFAGILLDAACKASQATAECEVSAGTTSFGILTADGKFLKFDANGNTLAKREVGKSEKAGKISVSVTGTVDGSDTLHVENFAVN